MIRKKSGHLRKPAVAAAARRSPCPVACALDILGDRWTLLVVRDLILGHTRFRDFIASPEGIPTNILSERLERLQRSGIIEQVPAQDGTKRLAYGLTGKGKALQPLLVALRDWGLEWEKGTRVGISNDEFRSSYGIGK
ncbi:MAG: yodB [Pedosphaera sp.]|nr:yodB [Pedosphaera sp.]